MTHTFCLVFGLAMTETRSDHLEHSQFLFLILTCCPTQHSWIWLDACGIHLTSFIHQTSSILQICSRCMKEICEYKTPTSRDIKIHRKKEYPHVRDYQQPITFSQQSQSTFWTPPYKRAGGIWVMSWDTAIAAPQGRPRDRPGPGDEYNTVSSNPSLRLVPALQLSTKLKPKFLQKNQKVAA